MTLLGILIEQLCRLWKRINGTDKREERTWPLFCEGIRSSKEIKMWRNPPPG